MIVLGLEQGHNGTACLMKDGKILAVLSKERFSRKKNDLGYPREEIDWCLNYAGIKPDQIDVVAESTINEDMMWLMLKRESDFSIEEYVREQHEYFKPLLIEKQKPANQLKWEYFKKLETTRGIKETNYDRSMLSERNFTDSKLSMRIKTKTILEHLKIDPKKIRFVDHHTCHAHFAYFSSPFRTQTMVLTADAFGDGLNATVSIAKGNNIKRIASTNNCQLARIYRYITLLLGMKPLEHEYKVMGLAPYSDSKELDKSYKIFSELMKVEGLEFKWNKKPNDLYFHFKERLEGCRFDGIAGAVQKMVEEIMVQWVRNAIQRTGIRQVVFGGGLAMNIKLNMIIANMPEVTSLFVGPNPSDESNAIGVCYYIANNHFKQKKKMFPMDHAYFGPEYNQEKILRMIGNKPDKYNLLQGISNKFIAQKLAEGKTVGICRGRMEFGARALGNRSILANPSDIHIIKKINNQIKFRNFWMPFTPSILQERAKDYLVNPKNIDSSFMTIGFDSTPLARKDLIAAIHPADFTVRPQIVTQEVNPQYYDLIKEFEKLTGIGGVLNTSLNLHGSPMVCSPKDAVEVMDNSELDMMYFGDILLIRKNG